MKGQEQINVMNKLYQGAEHISLQGLSEKKEPKPCGLKPQTFTVSQLWRLDVQTQGVSRVASF